MNIKDIDGLKNLRKVLNEINGKIYHYDDFQETGLGKFGETLKVGDYIFKRKSSTYTLFEPDTTIAKAFNNHFSGFEFCVFESEKKFFGEHDKEPSITALIADDRMYIVGYSNGFEV